MLKSAQSDFEFVLKLTAPTQTYRLPLVNSSGISYDFYVEWGDGQTSPRITTWSSADKEHIYNGPTGQEFTVRIYGKYEGHDYYSSTNTDSRNMLYKINSCKADIRFIRNGFRGCMNLISGANKVFDCLNPVFIQTIYGVCMGCSVLTDTVYDFAQTLPNVTDVQYMYYNATSITGNAQPVVDTFKAFPAVPAHTYAFRNSGVASTISEIDADWK